jgi:hypothetical protein
MVGEQLAELGVERIVGVDLLEEARDAALRDRPEVYDEYLALDMTELEDEPRAALEAARFNCMTCVSPEPGASISTVPFISPRACCASATPPISPSLPTVSGIARPARSPRALL